MLPPLPPCNHCIINQVPHPGLVSLHALGVGPAGDGDPRGRLFAGAISPLLDHRALAHVHPDDLKLFAFLYYLAHPDAEARAAGARRLDPFEVRALVASHFAMRSNRGWGLGVSAFWELPNMRSTSEGGGGSWRSRHSKGGCVNFIA